LFCEEKRSFGIQTIHVYNMDEVPMSFDAPHSRTVDLTGAGNRTFVLGVREKAQTNGHL